MTITEENPKGFVTIHVSNKSVERSLCRGRGWSGRLVMECNDILVACVSDKLIDEQGNGGSLSNNFLIGGEKPLKVDKPNMYHLPFPSCDGRCLFLHKKAHTQLY